MRDISMIDRNAHYFILMHPLEGFDIDGISFRYVSNRTREKWVECEIVEDRYKLEDGYKIDLKSIEPGYGRESFYIDDFIQFLNNYRVFKKEPNMECVEETWDEPLTDNVHVTHSAYTLKIKPSKK